MSKREPHPRDYPYLDDWTSVAIVAAVLLAGLGIVAGAIALVYTGAVGTDITVSGDVRIIGTVPVGYIVAGVGAGIAWMVYVAFTDIYGARRVEQATDAVDGVQEDDDP